MNGLSVVYVGGRQAGCVGLLTVAAARCRILGVVAYDEEVTRIAEGLRLASCRSIHDALVRDWLARSELLVSVHGREIVPPALLSLPRHGGINAHPCLWAYKGASPVERLLRDRNPRASVGVHRMTQRLDEGEVLAEEFVDVPGAQRPESVYNALYPLYASVLLKALRRVREPSGAGASV